METSIVDVKQLPLRIPADLKAWIEDQAERNGSSQNSEIIRAIRERMDRVNEVRSLVHD